ncbi:MAG: hypothetical protein HY736_25250 [Verrucomicrobia bacterium]|nr:hypothetical protein [Verrucomicrobiota bacterium]
MPTLIRLLPLAGLAMLLAASSATAADKSAAENSDPIQKLLERPLLAPKQTQHEAEAFCDERVPRMPAVKTAAEWDALANKLRRDVLDRIVFRGAQARQWRDARTQVVWGETMPGGPGYRIRKLRYEALPGLWIPAVLYEPENLPGKAPVHLAVNGHERVGKSVPYKQIRCINLAKRGIISLNVEWLYMGQLRTEQFKHYAMNQLDLCGVSGLAPFYLAMSRGLDVLLALADADAARVAVSGLSGGGWQTIFISSLDPRVTLCNPVAGYSSFRTRAFFPTDLGDSEQTPNDLATVADYTHLTAMMAGRAALLTFNAKDNCCFAAGHALEPLLQAAAPMFALHGQASRLQSHVNYDPGTHNYERDNREAFYRFVGDMFFPGDRAWNPKEIPSDAEVKTNVDLNVELPENNLDFNQLARAAMQGLPRDPQLAARDPAVARATLRAVVHFADDAVAAKRLGRAEAAGPAASFWELRVGQEWTVPVVEFTRGTPVGTTIVLADAGRRSLAAEVEKLLDAGQRVLAVDLLGFGESNMGAKDFLYAMTMAAVGGRPLGVQSGELAAVARWAAEEFKGPLAALAAFGPRTSFIALVTAALERAASGGREMHQAMSSLKELIEKNHGVNQRPEQFCFGLLEAFDVPQLQTLADAWRPGGKR